RGEPVQARRQAIEALSLCETLEDPRGIASSLEVAAALLAHAGQDDAAARMWGASEGLLVTVNGSLVPTLSWIQEHYMPAVKRTLGAVAFKAAAAEGRAMPAARAMAFAREQPL